MDDGSEQGDGEHGPEGYDDDELIGRAVLGETPEGKAIAAAFIASFGEFVSGSVRPVLREVADAGGEPQLLVNGLAQLMREVAASLEFPIATDRAGAHPPAPEG
jgi:hypothetical protein